MYYTGGFTMSVRVPATADYFLLNNVRNVISSLARNNLVRYTIDTLVRRKLVTRNFKAGLNFLDNYTARADLKKFWKVLQSNLLKQIDYLNNNVVVNYLDVTRNRGSLFITVVKDPSNARYIRRLNRLLLTNDIPLTINISSHNYYTDQTIRENSEVWTITMQNSSDTHKLYKLLDNIDLVFKVLSTLHRRAVFTNESIRRENLSRRVLKKAK